mmetsp:Transcript_36317/g.37698  ORF Transcript_36317/g.37698 Transcript_36317/m.37698 type:complete len:389 (-) Transcript_36317:60-1226(-)
MSYVQISGKAFSFLDELKTSHPNLNSLICEIQGELNLRLWHQLCEHLIELSEKQELHQGSSLIELYNNVVNSLEPAFNPMKIMLILKNVIRNFHGRLEDALIFLEDVNKRLPLKGEECFFMSCLKADCLLGLDRLHDCNDILKEVKVSLENLFDVDHIVYAYFYKLFAFYYEKKQNHDEFYNYALQFFAYCKDDSISTEDKLRLCYKMALSSLIGEKMFNFAELIEKEYFKILIDSQYEWVYNLIRSISTGKVDQFVNMLSNYKTEFEAESVLTNKKELLDLKVRITALLDLVFQKNKNERVLSFREISAGCCCDSDQVEVIVMKALSLGLIKGHLDEVEKVLVVTWIQPKYLEKEKLSMLSDRLDAWINKTNKTLVDFEEKSKSLVS